MLSYKDLIDTIYKLEKNCEKLTKQKGNLINISLAKTFNINTGHKSKMVLNKWHNLQTKVQTVQM